MKMEMGMGIPYSKLRSLFLLVSSLQDSSMKFSINSTLIAFGLVAVAAAAPAAVNAESECTYPIGTGRGSNAKVNGRLFEIDDRVEHFAGKSGDIVLNIRS
jgi:hypothetical protein